LVYIIQRYNIFLDIIQLHSKSCLLELFLVVYSGSPDFLKNRLYVLNSNVNVIHYQDHKLSNVRKGWSSDQMGEQKFTKSSSSVLSLSRWSLLHLQSLAPTPFPKRVDVKQAGRKSICKNFYVLCVIYKSLPQQWGH
jgi:hypothetical protein